VNRLALTYAFGYLAHTLIESALLGLADFGNNVAQLVDLFSAEATNSTATIFIL